VATTSPLLPAAWLRLGLFCIFAVALRAHITTLVPSKVTAGGPAFTLQVTGEDLEPGEFPLWNGTPLNTTVLSSTRLEAIVPADLIRTAGAVVVTLAGFNSLPFVVNPTLAITSTSPLPNAPVGAVYSHRLLSSGGTDPFEWTVSSGALPDGLTLTRSTGVIAGTARTAGTSTFVVRLSDGGFASTTKSFTLTVSGSGTGSASPSCDVTPRNMFLAVHQPENHAPGRNAYPDHTVRVVVNAGASAPAGVAVTLSSSRAVFADASRMPASRSATATTDASGAALFKLNPPAAAASDRTDLMATARRGADNIQCSGSVVVGVGTLTATGRSLSTPSTAALRRLKEQFKIDHERFGGELERVVRGDTSLESRALSALSRFDSLVTAMLDGKRAKLGAVEIYELDGPRGRESLAGCAVEHQRSRGTG